MQSRAAARVGAAQTRSSARRIVVLLAALAGAALALTIFLPVSLGGSASYVVTDGTSMLPHFRANGLVIARSESDYHVGEVVAYHNRQLKRVVMHRIVAMDGDRYVFRGDNNPYADQFHPSKSDIVGKEWVYWPGAGRYLDMVRSPLTFAILIGIVTLLAFLVPQRYRHRRRHHA